MFTPSRVGFAAAALIALTGVAGCATTAREAATPDGPRSASVPVVAAGDWWEYAVRDGYTGFDRGVHRLHVVSAGPDRMVVDVLKDGEHVDTRLYAPGWQGLEHPLPNIQRLRYEPAFPRYVFPLASGARWYRVVTATDPETGARYRVHTRARVAGWERVSVPAGAFDALRIEREIFAGNATARKTQEVIRQTDWYVPRLGRVVREQHMSEHFDDSRGGGNGGGEYPLRISGDWLIAELVRHSRE